MGTINRYMATLFSISAEHRARFNLNNKEDVKRMSRSIFDFQSTVKSDDIVVKTTDAGGRGQAGGTTEAEKSFVDSAKVVEILQNQGAVDSAKVVEIIAAQGGAGGSGLTAYSTLDSLPSTNLTSGDQAFVSENNRLYISNGSGWYNVALFNLTPSFDSSILSEYTLADSTDSITISVPASDSDNSDAAITYSHEWTDVGDSADYIFRVSQDSSVFTITPMGYDSAEANVAAGHIDSNSSSIGITFKATDGISQTSMSTNISYTWAGFAGFELPNNTFTFYGSPGNFNTTSSSQSDGTTDLRYGPTLTKLKANYSSHAWTQNAQNFWIPTNSSGVALNGYQTFRAPRDGNYTFDVYGACGGNGTSTGGLNNPQRGGRGARMRARINNVSRGDYSQVIVGHSATGQTDRAGGGGGGSFVLYKPASQWTASGLTNGFTTSDLVIAAGGGGGGGRDAFANRYQEGVDASTSSYTSTGPGTAHRFKVNGGTTGLGNRSGGTNGNAPTGANGVWGGGDGAGFKDDADYAAGQASGGLSNAAKGYDNGLQGGICQTNYGNHGGFGGGGGGTWGSGGGGGYSGGAGDYSTGSGTFTDDRGRQGGGGGGSYINTSKAGALTVQVSSAYTRSGWVIMSIA